MNLEPRKIQNIHATYHRHPLLPAADRHDFNMTLEGDTLQDLLNQFPTYIHRLDVIAYVNGDVVPRLNWGEFKLKEGDEVVLKQRVAGGGGQGGSNPLQIVLMVAVLVLAIYTGGVAAAAYGGWGTTAGALAGSLAQAAVMVAGALLVNALFPPVMPKGMKQEQTYILSGQSNQARLGEPVPLAVGTVKMYPDLAARPFGEQDGDDSYLNTIFNYGFGDLVIANTKIGTTNLGDFQEVTYQWSDANNKLSLFPSNVDSIEGGELSPDTGWVTKTTSINTTLIALDIGGALYRTDDTGKATDLAVDIEIQISPHGANTWTAWTGAKTGNTYQEIIGDFNRDVENYIWNNGVVILWNGSTKPLRFSTYQTVDKGQYDVRVRRITKEYTSTKKTAQIAWGQMRCYQPDDATYSNQTRLAVRIRATGQLNGTIDSLNSIVSARIPVWTGSAWTTAVSSNPAWIFLYLARGLRDGNNKRLFGAGLADSRIDIAGIKEWGLWCDSKGLECNYVFNSSMTVYEMLTLVARCGRAAVSWQKGVVGVVYDKESLPVTQLFTPANILNDSFSVTYLTKNIADQITVKFNNKDLDYQEDTVSVNMPGVTEPENPVEIPLLGVTTPNVAFKEAALQAARQYYNRRRVSWDTDIEGLVCSKGDVVSLSHDLTSWAVGGRLITANTTHLQLDRDVTFSSANTHYISIRQPSGTITTATVVNPYAGSNVTTANIVMTSPLSFNPSTDTYNDPRDYMWMFDPKATPGKKLKVVSVVPNGENKVTINAIDEVPEYYDAENWASTYVPPNVNNRPAASISNVQVTEEFQGYDKPLKLHITWDMTQAKGALIQTSYNGGKYVDQGEIQGASYEMELVSWKSNDTIKFYFVPIAFDTKYDFRTTTEFTYTILGLPAARDGISLPRITGLELFGQALGNEFGGKDAKFVWRRVTSLRDEIGNEELGADTGVIDPYFAWYEVRIYTPDHLTLLRTEVTKDESYTYSYEKNAEDNGGTAIRTFMIEVRYVSKTNEYGEAAAMVATNPAPAAPSNLVVNTVLKNLYVSYTRPNDLDVLGTEIHIGASSGFTPNSNTLIYRGPESAVTLESEVTGLTYSVAKYVKVGCYDGFSNTAVNYSTANTVNPQPLSDIDSQTAINSRQGLINNNGWVDPCADTMGSWTLLAGSSAKSNVTVAGTGPFNDTAPVMTIKGDSTAPGWYSEWKADFSVTPTRGYIAFVWVKRRRTNTTSGLNIGWTAASGKIKSLAGAEDTNPLFVSNAGSTMTAGVWYLAVGVLHTTDATTSLNLAGIWDPSTGTRLVSGNEYKHYDTNVATQYLRYGFYSNTTAYASLDGFDFVSPSVYLMDGAQPSIESLLRRSYQQGALAQLSNVNFAQFASGIEPVEIVVGGVPGTKQNSNTIFVTTTAKLYRWNGSAYSATVANTDFTGQITSTQILDGSISTPKLAAGSVTTAVLAAGSVNTSILAADSVTAGKIAAAAVSTSQLAAGAVTAGKLSITNIGQACNKNPQMNDNSAWYPNFTASGTLTSWSATTQSDGPVGTECMVYSGAATASIGSEWIPIDPNKTYRLSCWVKGSGSAQNYLTANFVNGSYTGVNGSYSGWTSYGTYMYWALAGTTFPGSWTKKSFTFGPNGTGATPTGAKYVTIGAYVNLNGSSSTLYVADMRLEEVIPGELIVDGAITAAKITVANLSSVKADMGAITAGTIALDSTGWIRSGQSGYDTGTGFWLGKDGSTTKFSLGNASGAKVTWDGTSLTVNGTFTAVGTRKYEVTPSDSTYLVWAGTGNKTDANAVHYIKQSGDAWFGGDIKGSFRPMAWLRFYSTSNGAYITRQRNIATITRTDTGRYTVTFSTALPNKYYVVVGNGNRYDDGSSGGPQVFSTHTHSTTGFSIAVVGTGGSFNDLRYCNLVVFGSDDTETDTIPPTSYDPYNDPAVGSNWSRTTNSGTLVP